MLKPYLNEILIEAGCDEAGRGCLAGPVFAAAVILPKDLRKKDLDDSKKLSEKHRYTLRTFIEENAISYCVAKADNTEIDEINILNATYLAMHRALDGLAIRPQHILVDGNRFKPYPDIPHTTIIKGDSKYLSIAASSILAKTYRDEYMQSIHNEHPEYDWTNNKGYPTHRHRRAILEFGPTSFHRKSFRLLPLQYKIDFTE
jgi:ribonuclease HII